MKHTMRLDDDPFMKILTGEKTIELRLNDEKRSLINVGDEIVFVNRDDSSLTLTCLVKAIHKFKDFELLYKHLSLKKCGYAADEIKSAHPNDMLKYYSKADQHKYGVLGIELTPLSNHEPK